MDIETGYVRVAPELRLFFRRMGADGPTVLLLHGWPQTSYAWRHVMPTLAASGYTVVTPDLRGAGDSDKPTNGYDAVTRAADARTLLQELALADAPVFVVGHGDGGTSVAHAFVAEHSDEVAALAVLNAAPGGFPASDDWAAGFHQVPDLPETLLAPSLDAYLRHFFQARAHDAQAFSEAEIDVYVRALAAPGALRASFAPFRAAPADKSYFRRNLKIRPPILLLQGDGVTARTRVWQHTIWQVAASNLTRQTISRGGFWLPEERPDPTAAALLGFFRDAENR